MAQTHHRAVCGCGKKSPEIAKQKASTRSVHNLDGLVEADASRISAGSRRGDARARRATTRGERIHTAEYARSSPTPHTRPARLAPLCPLGASPSMKRMQAFPQPC
eukprot:scaffold6397_cov121-Isochrysis_galbana.AAC.10